MRFKGFIGPSYTLGSVNQDCQRCVNLYPEIDALGTGKEGEVASLVSTPGLTSLVTLPTSPVRGVWAASNGNVYAVGGNTLYSISSSWLANALGTLLTSTGAVSMADNGKDLVIVDGPYGYYVSIATLASTSTVTSGITTTLTSSSTIQQIFTGSNTQTIVLPAVATLALGLVFYINNQSSQSILVQTSDSTAVQLMAPNSLLVMICTANSGSGLTPWQSAYTTNAVAGSTFSQIMDPNFLGANLVVFQDESFIFNKPSTQLFYCSDLLAVTFTANNTAAKESYPDNLVGQISTQENVYLFGSQSIEVWYDAGSTPCPFAQIQGAAIRVGCAAEFSIAVLQSIPYWLGGDKDGQGIVYTMNGYQPQRISTPAVEASIRSVGASNISGSRAWTYQQGGHMFYCLNVPGLSSTWVYDASTQLWHERTYLGSFGFERHRVDCAAVAYGINIGGDYASGNIYSLDQANFTDNNISIVRMRTAPHLSKNLNRLFHSRFQLDMETGVGLSGSSQGVAPLAMLQWSDDSGHSWSNEHYTSIGPIGATKRRVIWRRLGEARDRVYRVMISDPVKVTLLGAEIDVEEGAA